jgi:hypothetical protein
MKYIYVLEDDDRFQDQIFDAIKVSEPDAQIRFFSSMFDFQNWIPLAIKSGPLALVEGGFKISKDDPVKPDPQADDHLMLLISKDEWLGSRLMALVKKTQEMLVRKKICTAEDPTRLVMTSFENPDFNIKLVEDRIISNVIFKPFDLLILKQHLHFALKGHHPGSEAFVHAMQVKQQVEMIKEVKMEAVSDTGFVTRSPRKIEVGKISKYYGEVFKGKTRIYVMGRCLLCLPHPEFKDEFQVWFTYMGLPNFQVSDIRRSMIQRNETEFSADSLPRPTQAQNNWVILDPDPLRAEKWKDLLFKKFKVDSEIISSFESFYFQIDPAAADQNQKEQAWTEAGSIKLTLDAKNHQIIKVEPESVKTKKILGLPWAELENKPVTHLLGSKSQSLWEPWIQKGCVSPETFFIQSGGNNFLLKAMLDLTASANEEVRVIELFELGPEEKTIWYDQNYPNPLKAFCLVLSSEYANEEKIPFWVELIKNAKAKQLHVRVIVLFEKAPEEKMVRLLDWAEDLFDDSNEPPYIERKLRWHYFGEPKEKMPTPFLSASKEMIQAANPVEIAEISEAGIVINYTRSINLGAFRKFVFPKNESNIILRFLSNCNYSTEHPTEKGQFQIHFVFFGITDLYLKTIRLWILENYVQSKQEEN